MTTVLSHIPHNRRLGGGSQRVFGWPGMGSLMFSAINNRDFSIVMGVTVVIALTVLCTNLSGPGLRTGGPQGPVWEVRRMRRGGMAGVWSRFCQDRRAVAGLCVLAAEILCVLLLPPLMGLEPNVTDRSAGFWAAPSAAHWLGTDDVGRDLFARLVCGGRISLLVGFAAAGISVAVGVPLGAGRIPPGRVGIWIMRCADVVQSFPSIVLVLCLVAMVGASVWNIILVIGLLGWTSIAPAGLRQHALHPGEGVHPGGPGAGREHRHHPAAERPAQRGGPGVGRAGPAGGAGHPV